LRGGCWGNNNSNNNYGYAQHCRSAFRYGNGPSYYNYYYGNGNSGFYDYGYGVFGFRVCVRPLVSIARQGRSLAGPHGLLFVMATWRRIRQYPFGIGRPGGRRLRRMSFV